MVKIILFFNEFLHRKIGFHIVFAGVMEQHHVDIADV